MHNDWITKIEICNKLEVSPRTVQRMVHRGEIRKKQIGYSMYYQVVDPTYVQPESKITSTHGPPSIINIPVPKSSYDKGQHTKNYNEQITSYLNALATIANAVTFEYSSPKPQSDTSLCLLLSDTHIGQKTNYYNSKIGCEAISEEIPELILDAQLPFDIGEVVILLGGDMIEGEDIYQTQPHHIDLTAIEQVEKISSAIMLLAKQLNSMFDCPVKIETVPGNHGRVSRTADERSNWDNVVYQNLALASSIAKGYNPNFGITVNKNFNQTNVFKIQGHKVMLYHEGPKHTGTPAMKIKLAGWFKTHQWDVMACGHWHEWSIGGLFGKPVIKNGSLVGYNDLAERMGVYDPPRQAWWLMTKEKALSVAGYLEFKHARIG